MANLSTRVLVTGATGYVGIHCVNLLLKEGYLVRGTVRSLSNEEKLKPLRSLEGSERLELVEANLDSDDHWEEVVQDCTYILHVASPFVINADESVIKTAVDGSLRVLKAATKAASVKKIVLTSSCAAINEGHTDPNKLMSEEDWSNVESPDMKNYSKSKTMAERAAWDFVKNTEGVNYKLTTINPSLIIGPLLQVENGASAYLIKSFLDGSMPAYPAVQFGLVDVRDVALAHVKAMRESSTDGERIIASSQPSFWFRDIADAIRAEFGQKGYRIPRIQAPYPILWLYSWFNSDTRQILMRVGKKVNLNNEKAKRLLGIDFIEPKKSLTEMIYSMIDLKMIPKK